AIYSRVAPAVAAEKMAGESTKTHGAQQDQDSTTEAVASKRRECLTSQARWLPWSSIPTMLTA
ncbi:MAG: hypothetical protein WDZ48_03155, partial [Pirellulales bacterium]